MSRQFYLAHLSDVHLGPMPVFWPRHWNLKRAFGYINWVRKRRFVHRLDFVDRLVADLHKQRLDHIAVAGDLANIGMPQEHERALAWLATLGDPEFVSVVPGNHDIYCKHRSDIGTDRWSAYMTSNGEARKKLHANNASVTTIFPYVRRWGQFALIGVNSSLPTAPSLATGLVDREQLARLENILQALGRDGVFRIVMVHHPPLPGLARPRRALINSDEMQAVLQHGGAELVIHGHNHRHMLNYFETDRVRVPVVGVPSFSAAIPGAYAAYNIYAIKMTDAGCCDVEMIQRAIEPRTTRVHEVLRCRLMQPAPVSDKQI